MAEPRVGWDSIENFLDALARGETPGVVPQNYVGPRSNDSVVQPGLRLPVGTGGTESIPTSSGFLGRGMFASAAPGIMVNVVSTGSVLGGAWAGFNPQDLASGLAILRSYSAAAYGSAELGVIRRSSEVLENEPTGIRPGSMERIVLPWWARNFRGSPN